MASGKRPTVSEMRAIVAEQTVGIEEIASHFERSINTVKAWTYGRTNVGAPPFPPPATRVGTTRIWCKDEVAEWIAKWGGSGRVTAGE